MKTIKTYKYFWLCECQEKMFVNVITGTDEQHEGFVSALKEDETITNICRTYVCEYDVEQVARDFEPVYKKEGGENETL